MTYFESPPSTSASWMPALIGVMVLGFVPVAILAAMGPLASALGLLACVTLLVLLLTRVWSFMRRPLRYDLVDGVLVVPGYLGPVRVPLRGAHVTVGVPGGWKVSGTNLGDFLLGAFRDRDGAYHAAASAPNGVWVRGARRVFITPADIPGFLQAVAGAGAEVVEG